MRIKGVKKLNKNTKYDYRIVLSSKMIKNMKWKEGQKLVVTASQKTGKIVIKDWQPSKQQ